LFVLEESPPALPFDPTAPPVLADSGWFALAGDIF